MCIFFNSGKSWNKKLKNKVTKMYAVNFNVYVSYL